MLRKELSKLLQEGKVRYHSASCRGYVSRKSNLDELQAEPYKGKYGEGWIVYCPFFKTTQYCKKEYYILINERKENKKCKEHI